MIKWLKLWYRTIRLNYIIRHTELTPKGACFLEYLKRKQNGEEIFVAAYQANIQAHMDKQNVSEKEVIDGLVDLFSLMHPCSEHQE